MGSLWHVGLVGSLWAYFGFVRLLWDCWACLDLLSLFGSAVLRYLVGHALMCLAWLCLLDLLWVLWLVWVIWVCWACLRIAWGICVC